MPLEKTLGLARRDVKGQAGGVEAASRTLKNKISHTHLNIFALLLYLHLSLIDEAKLSEVLKEGEEVLT